MVRIIRRFLERGLRGYCREDLWNFDHFLSGFLTKALRDFKKQCHTYPNDLDDWATWQKILDEMIECFEEQTRDAETNFTDFLAQYDKRMVNKKVKLHRGLELLERYYYDLWD